MLFDHKAELYTKDNLIIAIAGKIKNKQAIVDQLANELQHIPTSKKTKKPIFIETLPKEHTEFYEQKNKQSHLVISAPGFKGDDETKYAATVLGTIL